MNEAGILLRIHGFASPALDSLFRFSHDVGTLWFFLFFVPALIAWHLWRGEKREALAWLLLGLSTFALQAGIKLVFERPRPALWPRLVPESSSFAFPSGHALASATFYPFLAWALARGRRHFPFVLALGVGLAFFIGFGRLYLGVHWPTDVLAGWALGAAQTAAAVAWLKRGAPAPGDS